MNRVASVTVLKDAASTAIYGSKASNGVVVIETKAPAREDFSCHIKVISDCRLLILPTITS